MAKQLKDKKHKSIEETLWDSANKLRGTVEPSEYKHVVLGLIFLKFASDKFEERKLELVAEGKDKFLKDKVEDDLPFYAMKNVFYTPENAMLPDKKVDIVLITDTFHHFEKPVEMMKNIKPSLKRNGIIIIVDRDSIKSRLSPSEKVSREKLTRLSKEAGYEIIKENSDLFEQDNIYFLKPTSRR
jgi:type I restriction-modification system DNA methylase subunit